MVKCCLAAQSGAFLSGGVDSGLVAAANELRASVDGYPSLEHTGYTQDALKEYAEALITLALERQAIARVLDQTPWARVLVVGLAASVMPEAFEGRSEPRRNLDEGPYNKYKLIVNETSIIRVTGDDLDFAVIVNIFDYTIIPIPSISQFDSGINKFPFPIIHPDF